jgi:hypothetical protein
VHSGEMAARVVQQLFAVPGVDTCDYQTHVRTCYSGVTEHALIRTGKPTAG